MHPIFLWARAILLHPSNWLFACIVATAALSIIGYRCWGKNRFGSIPILPIVWIGLTLALIIVVSIVFTISVNLVVNNRQRTSPVEALSLAQLSEEQVASIEEAVILLAGSDFAWNPNVEELPDHPLLMRRYRGGWFGEEIFFSSTSMRITVNIYRREDGAIGRMQLERRFQDSFGEPFTEHTNLNATEVILRYPFMQTSASGWHFPNEMRQIRSYLRIGNVVIELQESRQWYNMDNDYSTQFINLLVEMLQEND